MKEGAVGIVFYDRPRARYHALEKRVSLMVIKLQKLAGVFKGNGLH
jgi:hypothetical protein